MSLTLFQTYTAIAAGLTASFLAVGGTAPYVYSVQAGGAGGSIDSSTGVYTGPNVASSSPNGAYDTISVTDSSAPPLTVTSQILIGTPLFLFCDILQNQLGLDNNHIYVWNQKLFEPKDYGLYIAVSVINSKPFGNSNFFDGANQTSIQSINVLDTLSIDVISRGPAARDQKELILLALKSTYAEQQMEKNSFRIGTLPIGGQFLNLSDIDGAAIPYRYRIQINMQYFVINTPPVDYYSSFPTPQVIVNN